MHISVLKEKHLRTKVLHRDRRDRGGRYRRHAIDEQQPDRDEDQVVRRAVVIGEGHGKRVERIGRQANEKSEYDQPRARSRLAAQRDLACRARDHDRGHDEAAVDPVGDEADRKDPQRRPEHDRGGEPWHAFRRHSDFDREKGTEREQSAIGGAGGQRRETRNWRCSRQPHELGTHAARLGRRVDPCHRHGHDCKRKQRARDIEGRKAARPEGPERQLSASGRGEVRDLVEGIKRAAIGVGRLGVDPGFDHRVKPCKHEADQCATDQPGAGGEHDRHEDHGNDRERHKSGVSSDMAALPDDGGRRERPGQHSGEVDGTEQSDSQVGKALNAGSKRRRHPDQAVAANEQQHGQQQRGNGWKRTHTDESALEEVIVSYDEPRRVPRTNRPVKKRGCLENRHTVLSWPPAALRPVGPRSRGRATASRNVRNSGRLGDFSTFYLQIF